jgi:hypothetical protein
MCIELWISDRIGLKSFISNSCIKGNKLEDDIKYLGIQTNVMNTEK